MGTPIVATTPAHLAKWVRQHVPSRTDILDEPATPVPYDFGRLVDVTLDTCLKIV